MKTNDHLVTSDGVSYKVPPNTMIMRSHSFNLFSYDESKHSTRGLVFNKTRSFFEFGSSSSMPTYDDEEFPDNEQIHFSKFKIFSYDELKCATKNFRGTTLSEEKRGRVYTGWVDKRTYFPTDVGVGVNIMVQRFDCWGRGNLYVLGELDHPNLQRILGYCLKDEKLYLVHEITGGRSLYDVLQYGDMAFTKRIKIAVGVARALVFLECKRLHVKCWVPDTHEISLAEDDNPKLLCFEVAEWFRGLPLQGPLECNGSGLGLLLMEIFTGKHLFAERGYSSKMADDIWDQITEMSNTMIKDAVDPKIGVELVSLIDKCIKSVYTIKEALNHLEQIYSRMAAEIQRMFGDARMTAKAPGAQERARGEYQSYADSGYSGSSYELLDM